jgi:uncharacterized protein DUF4382
MKLDKLNAAFACLALLTVAALVACDTSTSSSGGRSGVSLYLTDAPLDLAGVHAVNVTLSGVALYPTDAGSGDAGGIELESGPISLPGDLTLNLLDFQNGQVTFVGSQAVPAGSYNRLRLQVVSAELVRDDDNDPATPDLVEAITVPSSKVDVPVPFTLTAGENLAITIDFNAQASVQVNTTNGKNTYLLRPVINVAGLKTS